MKTTACASSSGWASSSQLVASSPTMSQRWTADSLRMWVGKSLIRTVRPVHRSSASGSVGQHGVDSAQES